MDVVYIDSQQPSRSDFKVLKLIGKGGFAKVYLVQHISTAQLYAMKVMNKVVRPKLSKSMRRKAPTSSSKSKIYMDGMNELEILANLDHPFLVSLKFAFHDATHLFLVLDWAPGGELYTQIATHGMCLEDDVVFYLAEILLALEHLHSLNIIYRDLKLENVLIDASGHIKLTDFGMAKFNIGDPASNTWCGTHGYMAPEMITKRPYDEKVDTWGLGILAFVMLTGTAPFDGNCNTDIERAIKFGKPKYPYYMTREACHFINQALTKDPEKRPSLSALKKHIFFRSVNWTDVMQRTTTPPVVPCNAMIQSEISNLTVQGVHLDVDATVVHNAGLWNELGLDNPLVHITEAFRHFYFPPPPTQI